jgi:glycerol-3-phosphate O-acyltransferase
MSIRWLLEAFKSLQANGTNVTIVPVSVSYDRIYEHDNLATEMINGIKTDYTFITSSKQVWTTRHN